MRIEAERPDWHAYIPWAKSETSKFYRKQERGRFRYEELLSVAVAALATAQRGWRKAVRGALVDHAREAQKVVRDVEISESAYFRAYGERAPPIDRIPVEDWTENGVRTRRYKTGPYRSNYQLLSQPQRFKHGKVCVALKRSSYDDDWSQTADGWVRAKIDDDEEDRDHDPRGPPRLVQRGGVDQSDYTGRGRERRFSVEYFNGGVVCKPPSEERPGGDNIKSKIGARKHQVWIFRRTAVWPLDISASGRRTSNVLVDMTKYGLEPVPKDKLGRWRKELAVKGYRLTRLSSPSWHREAGYFMVDWGRAPKDEENLIFVTAEKSDKRADIIIVDDRSPALLAAE